LLTVLSSKEIILIGISPFTLLCTKMIEPKTVLLMSFIYFGHKLRKEAHNFSTHTPCREKNLGMLGLYQWACHTLESPLTVCQRRR
jgi:hypothetical protein